MLQVQRLCRMDAPHAGQFVPVGRLACWLCLAVCGVSTLGCIKCYQRVACISKHKLNEPGARGRPSTGGRTDVVLATAVPRFTDALSEPALNFLLLDVHYMVAYGIA